LTTAWKLFQEDRTMVAYLCNRRFDSGDGLILLENDPESDFKMVYYNSDVKALCVETEEDVWWFRQKIKDD
jgi:diaminopimelate epimerase